VCARARERERERERELAAEGERGRGSEGSAPSEGRCRADEITGRAARQGARWDATVARAEEEQERRESLGGVARVT
jgi:hypothetical protein